MGTAKQHVATLLDNAAGAADDLSYFDGRILNGFGELSDPSNARRCLRQAALKLQAALAALDLAERVGWSREDWD